MFIPLQFVENLKVLKELTKRVVIYDKTISQALDTKFYFCDPYSSWQRGLNEHTNGLIRQYIPKKSEFENIFKEGIATIANKLNHRPRKSLGYKIPLEVFIKVFSKKMAA